MDDAVVVSIAEIMGEYQQDSSSASAKYYGKLLTLTGGTVQGVMKVKHGEEQYIVSVGYSTGGKKMYKIDCYYPVEAELRLKALTVGQEFSPTGTWKGLKLMNCVWRFGAAEIVSAIVRPSRRKFWLVVGGLGVLAAGALFYVMRVML